MNKQKVEAYDGGDGFFGINVYDSESSDLIDQIAYSDELATHDAGYTHIESASKKLHDLYDVVETDDIVWPK